ncbi:MAG: aminotransferase class III-fold pyridoxal phosphate-dependent enzyme [Actinomycetia bacterium]|nr:aminotransferase class III-fold pyridoxal phosphate-dependent enzyme [Actinomycetes bacterium]
MITGVPVATVVEASEVAVAEARAAYAAARPVSAAQASSAAKVLPAGSTRSVLDFEPFPFRVASAGGALVHDVDGFTSVDMLGDYTAGLLGHNPPVVKAAVEGVLERGWSLGAIADNEHRLAELICGRFPSIDQIRFTNSGTEANLMAISLARHTTGRSDVAVFKGAYHGGLLYFGMGSQALRAPYTYYYGDYNDLDSVQRILDEHGSSIACLLMEPMMGAGGCLLGEPEFLAGVRQACTDHGVKLIFDEVMTSRMSIGGAQHRLGITPDMTTLGKYLGGGMTFGAFGASAEMMSAFDPARGGTLTHGGTFNNNAMTMAVGAAAVGELLTETALDDLFERGERLQARLTDVIGNRSLQITGWGSIFGLHPTEVAVRAPADLVSVDHRVGELLFHGLLAEGFYLAPRGFVALSLAVTDDQIGAFVAGFDRVLNDLSARGLLVRSS